MKQILLILLDTKKILSSYIIEVASFVALTSCRSTVLVYFELIQVKGINEGMLRDCSRNTTLDGERFLTGKCFL